MNVMESLPRDFGVDVQLHPSDIHTIEAIGTTPKDNIPIILTSMEVTLEL